MTAKLVEDNVYEYTVIQAGQPFVVEDSTGRVIARERGVLRYRVQWDTDGNFVDFLGVDVRGPHSSLDTCRYAADLIGMDNSTSSQRYTLRPAGTTESPLGYAEYLPPSYGQAPSPLLVFLHGSGESGDGSADALALQAEQAIPRHIANDGWPDERPFVVLAPQHDDTGRGQRLRALRRRRLPRLMLHDDAARPAVTPAPRPSCFTPDEVRDFIAYAVAAYDVDPARVYLTGLSCGGFGTWEYLEIHGDAQVAAAVPIAGEGRPAWGAAGCGLASVPIWAFHGALDDVVDPQGSIVPITGLRNQCGVADAGGRPDGLPRPRPRLLEHHLRARLPRRHLHLAARPHLALKRLPPTHPLDTDGGWPVRAMSPRRCTNRALLPSGHVRRTSAWLPVWATDWRRSRQRQRAIHHTTRSG